MKRSYYIALGGPEHLDFFEHSADFTFDEWFWTVPKSAKLYDIAFVYLTAPISRIVGKVMLISATFFNVAEFDNPKTQRKWMAKIACVGYFNPCPELTMRGLRSLFPDWAWVSYPRSTTKIPDDIVPPLLELTKKYLIEPDSTAPPQGEERTL